MKLTDRRRYDMLMRVREFGVNFDHLLPESTLARQALATIDEAVAQSRRACDRAGPSKSVRQDAYQVQRPTDARNAPVDAGLALEGGHIPRAASGSSGRTSHIAAAISHRCGRHESISGALPIRGAGRPSRRSTRPWWADVVIVTHPPS